MNQIIKPIGWCAAAVCAITATAAAQSEALVPAWTDDNGAFGGTPRNVNVSEGGARVVSVNGAFSDELRTYSAYQSDGTPFQEALLNETIDQQEFDTAKDASKSVWYRLVRTGTSLDRESRVSVYDSESSSPVWTYTFPFDPGLSRGGAAISRDGSRVVAWLYEWTPMRTHVVLLDGATGSVLATNSVATYGMVTDSAISDAGDRVLLSNASWAFVVDTQSGSVLHEEMFNNGHSALQLSPNGRMLAVSDSLDSIRVLEEAGGSFAEIEQFPVTSTFLSASIEFSADGSTIAVASVNISGAHDMDVSIYHVVADGLVHVYSEGLSTNQNLQLGISGLCVSDAGDRVVVGNWGDGISGSVPELLVYDRSPNGRNWSRTHDYDSNGSVAALDMSSDGSVIAIASKSTHMNQPGGGGRVDCFDLGKRRLRFEGVPRLGETLTFYLRGRAVDNGHLLISDQLDSTPSQFGDVGTLRLERGTIQWSQRESTDSNGWMTFQYTIPNDPTLVGEPLYLQGLSLGPRSLTDELISLTITQ